MNSERFPTPRFFLNYQDNKAYQLAALEQQNQLHDSLRDLNRSLLTNREERHTDVEELSFQVDGLREDLNRFFVDFVPGARHGELTFSLLLWLFNLECVLLTTSKQRRGWEDTRPVDLEGYKPLDRGGDPPIWSILRLRTKTCSRIKSTQIFTGTRDLPYRFGGATPQLLRIP